MANAVHAQDVHFEVGPKAILHGINIEVPVGQKLMLSGANGAGKSTLLNIISGVKTSTKSGIVKILGMNPRDLQCRRKMGLVLQALDFPPQARVIDVIKLVLPHFQVSFDQISDLRDRFGIHDILYKDCNLLSGGEKKRLMFVLAFAGPRDVYLLDEPFAALDAHYTEALMEFLKNLDSRNTLVMTSHRHIRQFSFLDRCIELEHGRIVNDRDFSFYSSRKKISMGSHEHESCFLAGFQEVAPDEFQLETDDPEGVLKSLVEQNVTFYDLRVQ